MSASAAITGLILVDNGKHVVAIMKPKRAHFQLTTGPNEHLLLLLVTAPSFHKTAYLFVNLKCVRVLNGLRVIHYVDIFLKFNFSSLLCLFFLNVEDKMVYWGVNGPCSFRLHATTTKLPFPDSFQKK